MSAEPNNGTLTTPTRPNQWTPPFKWEGLDYTQTLGLFVLCIVLVGIGFQRLVVLNPDLTWLITLDEKWLAGQKLYVDLFEVNPPISAIMYLPAVLMKGATDRYLAGIIVFLMVFFGAVEIFLTYLILKPILLRKYLLKFCVILLFLFLCFPVDVFGQRDYVAVVALFPFVAVACTRLHGVKPRIWLLILAGLGAGAAMTIKPHYAVVAGVPLLFNALARRSPKPLFGLEVWVAALVVLAYAVSVVLFFPAYLGPYLHRLAVAYVPVPRRLEFVRALLLLVTFFAVAGLACLRLSGDRRQALFAAPWMMAALGGALFMVLIGKWWSYTAYGMFAFAMAPLLGSLTETSETRPISLRIGIRLTAAAAALLCMLWLWVGPQYATFLTKAVGEVAPPHPRMITITDNISVGHPMVRQLNGVWVGTSAAQVVAAGALVLEQDKRLSPRKRTELDQIIDQDRDRLRTDIERGRPDIIVSDTRLLDHTYFDWWAWANQDPGLAKILSGYHLVGTIDYRFQVWKRNGVSQGGERMTLTPLGLPPET